MGQAHDDGISTVTHGGEAQDVEVVNDELKTPKMNGFTQREAIA
jgi:hypothetical protein